MVALMGKSSINGDLDCWISCQKVCHLHRGCLAGVMDQRPAWGDVRTWRRTPVLMATATHFSDAWGTHKISWTGCSQTELSLPWACHQFTICYQMLSNVTSPWHLQPTFPPAHFFRGHGTWPMDFDDLDDAEETLGPKLVDLREPRAKRETKTVEHFVTFIMSHPDLGHPSSESCNKQLWPVSVWFPPLELCRLVSSSHQILSLSEVAQEFTHCDIFLIVDASFLHN